MTPSRSLIGRHCLALLFLAPAIVHAQYALFGVGDLAGGLTQSEVRDATRVGSVLYAVGGSSANGAGNDTAFLWTSAGGITALPPIVPGVVGTNAVLASAITPNAAFIASRARFNPSSVGQRHAVRVTTAGLTNLDLGTLPGFTQNAFFSAANAISADGSVLYGFARYDGPANPSHNQAVRFTAAGPTITAIPLLNVGDDSSVPAVRGTSSDGSVMIGTSTNSGVDGGDFYGVGNGAFRYVEGSGVSAIPYLAGGTWNMALAVSPDGNLALVAGDSPSAPNGEAYLHNATTTTTTPLGTPAGGWRLTNAGGMTADGSLVIVRMDDPADPVSASFLHNANGWHEVQAIVAGTGVDLTGWTLDSITGMSPDGTRIWGAGIHNGNREGVVIEFPAGYLAAYRASLPAQSIVGSYSSSDTTQEGASVVVFLANGTYFQIEDARASDGPSGFDGFERGTYTWDPVTKAFTITTLLDTNGDVGASGVSGLAGMTLTMFEKFLTVNIPGPTPEISTIPLVTGSSPIVGSWVLGDTTIPDSSAVVTFFANGTYLFAEDGPADDPFGHDGMERGTYTWDAGTGAFTATTLVDTNGQWGLSHPSGAITITVNGNTLTYKDSADQAVFARVVAAPLAPSLAVPTSRRLHGPAGTFDLVLGGAPTNPTVEPRFGPNHNVVFVFDKPVTAGTATVTAGTATAGTPTFSGHQMTVPLTGVANQQYVTVTATSVDSADGGTGGSASVRIGYLAGDVNQNRGVSLSDLGQVNAQVAQSVTAANYLKDVNASGTISLADKGFTNTQLTKVLPAP